MVLPRIAPTPEAWARLYKPQAGDFGIRHDAPAGDFPFHVELWVERPFVRERTIAQVTTLEMANAAFDLARPERDLVRRPYLLLRHQRRVLRDSRRDFKVIGGGKGAD
jgi:hypothetical protein